ncbi:MAG: hypothetical protein ABJC51_03370 [Acidobacteriota bacterium]
MNWKISKDVGGARVAVSIGLAAAVLLVSGAIGLAHADESTPRKTLEGTWQVQVTLRNCATNATLGSFNSLVTFHRGGTISESTSAPVFAIGQRSSGHGNWKAEGRRNYTQRMVNLINFDTPATPPSSPGFFAGWSTVTHTHELIDADHATSSGTNEFYKADGTLYRTGCSTSVSTRFE